MKIKLKQLNNNPYKKWISEGKLNQEQIDRLKGSIKELGHMGSIPVTKKNNKYYQVSHHHRVEALKQLYGNDFLIEVEIKDYNDSQLFRGMVVENLTQRKGEFREEIQNLVAIREYLRGINRSESEQMKSKRKDGRGGRTDESGSIRDISKWLNKHGEIMSIGKINELLQIHDKLNPELFEEVESTHKGNADRRGEILSKTQAVLLSSIDDKDEQKDLADAFKNSREQRVREQSHLISIYKQAPENIKQQVRKQDLDIADIEEEIFHDELKEKAEKRPKTIFIPNFGQRMKDFNKNVSILEKQVKIFSNIFRSNDFNDRYYSLKPKQKKDLKSIVFNIQNRVKVCYDELNYFMDILEEKKDLIKIKVENDENNNGIKKTKRKK